MASLICKQIFLYNCFFKFAETILKFAETILESALGANFTPGPRPFF